MPLDPLGRLAIAVPGAPGRFPTYRSFSTATVDEVLGDAARGAVRVRATTFDHLLFLNRGGHFEPHPLPSQAQLAPAFGIVVADFDGDGHRDLALLETGSAGKSAVDFVSGNGSKLVYSEQIALGKDSPNAITTGDLDGDGRPDLVIALGSGGVAVMLNQTPGAMSSRSARWP